jgi:hypothetical protein
MSINKSRTTMQMNDQKMSDAVLLHLGTIASLPVGNTAMTPVQIAQIFKDRVATNQAVMDATAKRVEALQTDQDKRAQTDPVTKAVRRIVQGMFAQSPAILADFGLTPLKVATKSVETKSVAVAKAKATRVARHTMGSRQRAKITGETVSASTGSPATSVSAPAAGTAGPAPVTVTAPAAASAPIPAPATAPSAAPAPAPAGAPVAPQNPAH